MKINIATIPLPTKVVEEIKIYKNLILDHQSINSKKLT